MLSWLIQSRGLAKFVMYGGMILAIGGFAWFLAVMAKKAKKKQEKKED